MTTTETTTEANYVLWFRPNRCEPWRAIAQAASTAELVKYMTRGPSGEYTDLPRGVRPMEGIGVKR